MISVYYGFFLTLVELYFMQYHIDVNYVNVSIVKPLHCVSSYISYFILTNIDSFNPIQVHNTRGTQVKY